MNNDQFLGGSIDRRVCAVVAAFVLTTATMSYASDVLTYDRVAKMRSVTSVSMAPNGKLVAYTLSVPRDLTSQENGASWVELHVVDQQGHARPFVTGEVNISKVDWTPDGKRISFIAKRGDDKFAGLYAIPIDGGEAQKLVTHGDKLVEYAWNPDGSQVAFLAKAPESKAVKKLKDDGYNAQIYEEDDRFTRVWIHSLSDPDTLSRMLGIEGNASELHWSPNGRRLALAVAPTPLVDDSYMQRRIRVVDAVNGNLISKIDNPGKLGAIRWSPDSENLAFISAQDYNDPREGRLMVVSADGGELRDLVPNFEGHIRFCEWHDPQTITYLADQGVWTYINDVGLDAAHSPIFTPPDPQDINEYVAIGSPEADAIFTEMNLSKDGRTIALEGQSARHPGEVYLRTRQNKGALRLTDSNPWMSELRLAPQEVVRYTARDGLDVEGLLIRPLDEIKGQRYPLILKVHGGPESHYHNAWMTGYSSPGQIAAAQGYAVFHPNYRASTGRGVEYSKLDHKDPAGKEYDDLVDGVDYLIGTGLVDSAKVGVTGGSYGGYASAWCATYYSERFAASVMFVGLSDLVSKIGTTDIANEMIDVHYRMNPWENWQFFLERSPIYYADKSKTPTLILHGKDDTRVNPEQSLELYRHLKMRGQAPVRLVHYPGEKHGNRKAAARHDYHLRMMRWMDHYLKGPGEAMPPYELAYE